MPQDSWMARLKDLSSQYLSSEESTSVVRRRIRQPSYEVLLREKKGVQMLMLIGTYHVVHGELLGIGNLAQ